MRLLLSKVCVGILTFLMASLPSYGAVTVLAAAPGAPVITLTGSTTINLLTTDTYAEEGATATDDIDATVTVIIGGNTVDTATPGVYVVTYNATDSDGNAADEVIRTVTVTNPPAVDTTAPLITLTGNANVTVTRNGTYIDAGATALDDVDGDLTANILMTGAVNTAIVGTYTISYDVSDAAANPAATVTRTVDVVDAAPVVTLIGSNPQVITKNQPYMELSATAMDDVDGDVTGNIVVDASAVNTATVGNYSVTYTTTDSSGNTTVETRTVQVVDQAPVITLIGNDPEQTLRVHPYTDSGATATDDLDGDLTANIVTDSSAVNAGLGVVGTYPVTYSVTDSGGNTTLKTRQVNVIDNAPVITLNGSATVSVGLGSVYVDDGATAFDDVDGFITGSIATSGSVDTTTLGTYVITYDVTDSNGTLATQVTRTVNVVDLTAPLITLTGSATINLGTGDIYNEEGAIASDNIDPNFAASVGGDVVNTAAPGTYIVRYNATDAAGNSANEVIRIVTVTDDDAPLITLNGSATINLGTGDTYTEQGATASDNVDPDFSATVGGDSVNTSMPGAYTITYDATDAAGNAAIQVIRTVTVTDDDAPILTLIGNPNAVATRNGTYVDEGAMAIDNVDGDVGANIVASTNVDMTTVGTYTISYNVSDVAGNAATPVTRTVQVVDEAPVITLLGNSPVNVAQGSTYVDSGASAIDDVDGNLTSSIVSVNSVNTATVGMYTVTYDVTDANGTPAAQVTRTVNVVDLTAPVITLTGSASIALTVGDAYIDAGATAFDNVDGNVTASIVTGNSVDTSNAGTYTVTYNVSDSALNAATQVTRTIVVSNPAPTQTPASGGGAAIFVAPQFVTPTPNSFKATINNGAVQTATHGVKLTLDGGPSAVRMAISNDPSFAGVSQEPISAIKDWTLTNGTGVKTVYVKFYDANGNASPTQTITILDTSTATDGAPTPGGQVLGVKVDAIGDLAASVTVGSRGETVKALQQQLKDAGFYPAGLPITGYFGPLTKAALTKYLSAQTQSQVLGTKVATSDLGSLVTSAVFGTRGDAVTQLQTALQKAGFYPANVPITGFYGAITKAAVAKYQASL